MFVTLGYWPIRSQDAHKEIELSIDTTSQRTSRTLHWRMCSDYVKKPRLPSFAKAMSSEQYIVTVFSFKRAMPKLSKTADMDASFSSSLSNNQYGPPLDYSFRNISSLEKLERNRPPRQSLRKQVSFMITKNLVKWWQIKLLSTLLLYATIWRDFFCSQENLVKLWRRSDSSKIKWVSTKSQLSISLRNSI